MSEQTETENLAPSVEATPTVTETQTSLVAPTAEEAAPAEPAVAEVLTPLTAEDISFPEGLVVLDEIRDEFLTVVNNAELSPKDRAQALIDLQAKAAEQASEAASQAFFAQQQQWQDEVKNDPELGGAKFQQTLAGISRLVDQYGDEDFTAAMAATGAGNNIHVVRFFSKLVPLLTEPGPVAGQPSAHSESAASRLYPSMKG